MTREIKFRGRMKRTKQWMYGDLAHVQGQPCIQVDVSTDERKTVGMNVDPDSVGQFSGLHDKNGREIYEGDIILTYGSKGDEIKHAVYYSDKEAMFCTKLIGADMLGGSITQRWLDEFEFEVIGNIYDNPELLKED